jgi:hypothetical protein
MIHEEQLPLSFFAPPYYGGLFFILGVGFLMLRQHCGSFL